VAKNTVLLIDDSDEVHQIVNRTLCDFCQVTCVSTSGEALRLVDKISYDIVIIDLMLGHENGMDLLKTFKKESVGKSKYFIMTGKDSVTDEALGHTFGVDEYIKKPVDRDVLKAIVKKHLRNLSDLKKNEIRSTPFHLIIDEHRVFIDYNNKREEIQLTAKEFKILVKFVSNPEKAFSREDLFSQIWDNESESTYRTIDMHVSTLRKKLGDYGSTIKTVHQVGYKFSPI